MSDDVIRSVLRFIPLPERLLLSTVDEEIHVLATRWSDVNSLLVSEGKLSLGGEQMSYSWSPKGIFGETLKEMFTFCPAISRIFVQTKLTSNEKFSLSSKADTLQKLYISNENLETVAEWGETQFKRLRTLSVLQRMDLPFKLANRIGADQLRPFLSSSLRRVALTGVVLHTDALQAIFSLPNLRSLDLIGTAVDTKEASKIVSKLTAPLTLEEVSLPPSLFSFSNYANNKEIGFDFKWLKVPKVCIYMELFDEQHFFDKAESMLANETKVLVLYGNYARAKKSTKMLKWKKFKVLYGPSVAQVMDPKFSPGSGLLVSHFVRHSPYASGGRNQAVPECWRLDLNREVDEAPMRQEARAHRGDNLLRLLLGGLPAVNGGPPAPPVPPQLLAIEAPAAPQEAVQNRPNSPVGAAAARRPAANGNVAQAPRAPRRRRQPQADIVAMFEEMFDVDDEDHRP